MTMLHFSPKLGAFTRCKAFNRPGSGVTLCPNFSEGAEGGGHFAGMAALAAQGGGQIHRNGRLTTVTPNSDGTFTAKTGKLTRVYDADGNLIKLRERIQQGWSARERAEAENAAIKALVEAGAYDPAQVSRLSGIATLDKLRRIDQYEWANLTPERKSELITEALEDTAARFGVGSFDYSQDDSGQVAVFQPMNTLGQTSFYVEGRRAPVVALSEDLVTNLSNRTATDAIARQVAHLIEGRSAGHGPAWQKRVRELRASLGLDVEGNPVDEPHRKSIFEKEQAKLYAKNQPYTAKCATGKHTFYRKSLEGAGDLCANCHRDTKSLVEVTWRENADAGKWQLTKNGLEKLDAPAVVRPEARETRGRKVTNWKSLPAVETAEDWKAAREKMSPTLKAQLRGADFISKRYPEKTRKSPIVNEPEIMWPSVINSGWPLTEHDMSKINAFIAEDEDEDEESNPLWHNAASRNKNRAEVREAMKSYSPDPERIAFARSLRAKLVPESA